MLKCLHNRIKYICYECGGSSICPHNREKSRCYECGGGSICSHNCQKSRCYECDGSSICQHLKVRSKCYECGYIPKLCPHKRKKHNVRNVAVVKFAIILKLDQNVKNV